MTVDEPSPSRAEAFKSAFDRISLAISSSFDPAWYEVQARRRFDRGSEALVHYLLVGFGLDASPTPIFDPSWYRSPAAGDAVAGFSFMRYVENGWTQGNDPHPLFDVAFYAGQVGDDMGDLPDPITHFRQSGWKRGLKPHPLFDPSFYLDQNAVELAGADDPLSHYLRVGNARGYVSSPHFDTAWYRAAYGSLAGVQRDALVDYVTRGHAEGRRPNRAFDPSRYADATPDRPERTDPLTDFLRRGQARSDCLPSGVAFDPSKGFVTDPIALSRSSRVPLVSIIVANFDGRRHLPDLFASLRSQTYRNFEVVFVDDGSSDGSVHEAREQGCTRIVALPARVGFAAANNAGLAAARGEFIALLNNDVRVHDAWLESLVTRMLGDGTIGAVTSKLRFWGKFSRLRLTARSHFAIDREAFIGGLDYAKAFLRAGREGEREFSSAQHGADLFVIELDVPNHQETVTLPLVQCGATISVAVDGLPNRRSTLRPGPGPGSLEVVLKPSRLMERSGFYVINNAGTAAGDDGMPHDRGINEVDAGQYDCPQEVPFFCGCSVLVRRTALNGRKLFIDGFVAYYEDSELSLRLRRSGYKLFYEPTSVVEHRHSSTTVERSAFWLQHTSKNRALFRYILSEQRDEDAIEGERLRLNHLRVWYRGQAASTEQELAFADLVPETSEQMVSIARGLRDGRLPERNGTRVGLFNPYWNTLGGGEAHALNVAGVLRDGGLVELISTEDFDLEAVCDFFGIDGGPFVKRLVSEMTPEVTAEYDVFVNACYQSVLPSRASTSYYIVSFPGRAAPRAFTSSYRFLPNSEFTRQWMRRYWSPEPVEAEVVHPLVPGAFYLGPGTGAGKEAIVLSVGRFASSGHVKNQLEIAEVFRRLSERRAMARSWKLVLIGSANDLDYVEEVRDRLRGTNHDVIVDAAFETVLDHYRRAAIYLHASGLGQDLRAHPERAEHFGMAVAQAAASGCFPVVFDGAGPAEIVSALGVGDLFDDEPGMESALLERCLSFEAGELSPDRVRAIVDAASIFDADHFAARLKGIVRRPA